MDDGTTGDVTGIVRTLLDEMRKLREALAAPPRALYSLEDAATALGVSLTTVKRLVRTGEALTVHLSKRRMIPASEIRRLSTPRIRR